jgi:hypothetical protein
MRVPVGEDERSPNERPLIRMVHGSEYEIEA